jgi:hypothetical protein
MKKKAIIRILLILILLLNCNFLLSNEIDYDMKEDRLTNGYIKQNLKLNRKYSVEEDQNLFHKIIIGFWMYDPITFYEFKKDGKLKIWHLENYVVNEPIDFSKMIRKYGTWNINNNKLILRVNGNNIYTYDVEYYSIDYNEFVPNYSVTIKFKQKLYLGDNEIGKSFK